MDAHSSLPGAVLARRPEGRMAGLPGREATPSEAVQRGCDGARMTEGVRPRADGAAPTMALPATVRADLGSATFLRTWGRPWRVVIAVLALGCAPDGSSTHAGAEDAVWPGETWPVSTPANEGFDPSAIDSLIADIDAGRYGLVDHFLLIRHGRLVADRHWDHGEEYARILAGREDTVSHPYNYDHPDWHPFYRDTRLHTLQSVTKSVTSVAFGIAVDAGHIEGVDAPAWPFLADYGPNLSEPNRARATLEDFLTMRSGIDWAIPGQTYDDDTHPTSELEASGNWIDYVVRRPVGTEPGTRFDYNDGVSVLLGKVLREATGLRADAWTEEHLFRPIGIREYHWKITPDGEADTEGGLYLAPHDLARIAYLMLREGEWEGRRIVSRAWVRASTAPVIPDINPDNDRDDGGYGYQWWVPVHDDGGTRVYSGNGYGGQFLHVVPEHDLIVLFHGWTFVRPPGAVQLDRAPGPHSARPPRLTNDVWRARPGDMAALPARSRASAGPEAGAATSEAASGRAVGLRASYRLRRRSLGEALALAGAIAREQTVEAPPGVGGDRLQARMLGRIERIGPERAGGWRARIAYPLDATTTELTQILNVAYGNVSLMDGVRLVELALAPAVLRSLPGPRLGIAGVRALVNAPARPLVAVAIKPIGLSSRRLARQAAAFARAGVDVIKDDHGLAVEGSAPFVERTRVIAEAVATANARTGGGTAYFPNVTGPVDTLEERLERVASLGLAGVVLCPGLMGLDALRWVATGPRALAVMAHPAHAATAPGRGEGIAPDVLLGTLYRVAGADIVVYVNAGGRFSWPGKSCHAVNKRLREPLEPLRRAFPAPAGGVDAAEAGRWFDRYGPDTMLLIGGSLLARRNPEDAARRLVEVAAGWSGHG